MPMTYVLLVALGVMGVRLPAMGLKLAVGGGAFLLVRRHLKDYPTDGYALALRKVVRMQIVVMLLIELGTLAMVFVVPAETLGAVALGGMLLGFLLHCAIGVWGTLRLNALARSAVQT